MPHSIGALLAMNTCHSSKNALSRSCHFAVFVNSVVRGPSRFCLTGECIFEATSDGR